MLTHTIFVCFSLAMATSALAAVATVASADMDAGDFFPSINGNLTKITWAHAVNDKEYLNRTLTNVTIMMMEADVVYGKVDGKGDDIPIMGHPPADTSDLSLEDFLVTIFNYNQDPKNNLTKKGVKLDFKTTEVFEKSLDIINKLYGKIDYPIWINADIIKGPVNATTVPVDPDVFLRNSTEFTKSVMSLGWTTNYAGDHNITVGSYTDDQIDQMVKAIERNDNGKREITFAVRAGIAAQSLPQMKALKGRVPQCTLTVWSSAGDMVDVKGLEDVIFEFGVKRVYIDVPDELRDQLDLSSSTRLRSSLVAMVSMLVWAFNPHLHLY